MIFRFHKYDITTDGVRISHRWGTRDGIANVGGTVIEDTGTEVDASLVRSEIPGLTERDFQPNRRTGFQTQVLTS